MPASTFIHWRVCCMNALTGEPPFTDDHDRALIAAHLSEPPPRPSIARPDVPAQVDEVIATGMAKDPNQRYATTIELADAAHNAITVLIARPTPSPPTLPATEPAQLPPTQQAGNRVTAQPRIVKAESLAPAKPPHPAPPTPTWSGGISRRTTLALIAGAIAIATVIAVAVGIPALVKHRPSESSPTPSGRSYAAQVVLPFTGLNNPMGVAVDTAGAVYVIDADRVVKLAAGSSTQDVLPFIGLNNPTGVAVDSAGNVYVTDINNNRVLKLAARSSAQQVLPFAGLNWPQGVAVDSAGTVYVTDAVNHRVVKLAAGSSTQQVLPFAGLKDPERRDGGVALAEGVAVDSTGTVYVTDTYNNRVVKLAAGSSTQDVLPFAGLKTPWGVAVDSIGTLYVSDAGNNRVLKLPVQ